ncbi:2,3-bisphosphoglycerate-dependent phosphoglycerate mutase [Blastomyces silverae]|uniref:2,3-bisphosphoglycerate-dependent phosphoglycerate mutase n=1 Tax=Blastomyces silverae TaxID=2060906 RepID=A0A0H1BJS6_9EURO|nr:2,3-bisphosphoglycerate-dependent phosphoglycerate mutase [Blastomyces silverae]
MPSTPRCFIVRHGETEWSINGKHTGTTDLPLTEDGEKRVKITGNALVGHDRLIVPKNLAHIYVSPRHRARRTLELLEIGCKEPLPWLQERQKTPSRTEARVEITDAIREWDYGDYEGMKSAEIRELRAKNGEGSWDIWRDGCSGGESPDDVIRRLDALIAEIRSKYHSKAMTKSAHEPANGDVLIVAHGHILRAFAMRWIGKPLTETAFILEAGGVGTLRYV